MPVCQWRKLFEACIRLWYYAEVKKLCLKLSEPQILTFYWLSFRKINGSNADTLVF
jgi:hypothetical protein